MGRLDRFSLRNDEPAGEFRRCVELKSHDPEMFKLLARLWNESKDDLAWRRTAFPGRREVAPHRDGLGRPSYAESSPFG